MNRFLLFCCTLALPLGASEGLFQDLATVEKINKKIHDELPLFYNYSLISGYFNMPSARMPKEGMYAIGGGTVPPYNIYGMNYQLFDCVELSGNYLAFKGIPAENGRGDQADRIGNIKIGGMIPQTRTSFAVGADDFFNTGHFNSQYVVITQQWLDAHLETTLGLGKGRIRGFFGGISWSPFRHSCLFFLKDLSLVAEYDSNDYKKHKGEHPFGRHQKIPINAGLSFLAGDAFQVSVSSVRGEKVAAAASLRYPLGTTKGFFQKTDDPKKYQSPVDAEPLGIYRKDKTFAEDLAHAMGEQGLDLYTAYLTCDQTLWLKIINNRYREENVVRERLEYLLAALLPSNIETVNVVIEADGIPSHGYTFRREDLERFRLRAIGDFELATLSPVTEAKSPPCDASLLFHRTKDIWSFTLKPRILTFFGGAQGKFKYSVGVTAAPEGYLFDEVYYKMQVGYSAYSSMAGLGATDHVNPSRLINVRTDTLKYYRTSTLSLEKAYLQKSWNCGRGNFFRLATGYFEIAYGGVALEALHFPINSSWAIGLEGAVEWKRRYEGLGFTTHARKVVHHKAEHVHFIGFQYLLDLYYQFKPLDLTFKANIGQFLARDQGVRFEVSRYFRSGLQLALWYTVTNGHDKVNGQTFYDRGFAFVIPLDMFLKKSSRAQMGYAMSVWLRDVGALAETGKPLYPTLSDERR